MSPQGFACAGTWTFLVAARSERNYSSCPFQLLSFFLNLLWFVQRRPKQPKLTWLHMQFRPQISNLRSGLTSEAVWRLLCPLRPPKSPQNGSKTYKQYAHGYLVNWGHWFQIWGQIWPPRLFGGHSGLQGCQKGPYHTSNMHMDM